MMWLVVVGGDGDVGVKSDGGGDDDDGVRLRWPMVEVVLWWDGDGGDEGDGGGWWPEFGRRWRQKRWRRGIRLLFVDLPSELDHCTGELSTLFQRVKHSELQEDIQCAGSDTRPPMLDRTDFASCQQRIRLYCQGKENGVNILKSIDEGPFQMRRFKETLTEGTEGAPHLGPERP
ncbi:hypothetical protein Tco_0608147 [Tanacetum coccineum]